MVDYSWPEPNRRALIGKRISRLDGPAKSTGGAKYPSDIRLDNLLYGKFLTSPHAHARIVSIDVSTARSMPGVKAVRVLQDAGS